jgi:D-alanine transaminase
MAVRPRFAFCRGSVIPFSEATVPIDDRGLQFGESLYEVIPVTAGEPRLLTEHVARMQASLPHVGLAGGVPPLEEWQRLAAELIKLEGIRDGLMYAQLTGGAAPRLHVPKESLEPVFWAYVYPFVYPTAADVVRGVRAITTADMRWGRTDLKTTMLLANVLAKREASSQGASEAFFVGDTGEVYEGASSNLIIVEGRKLITPVQSSHLLPGTMRPMVELAAREAGLAVSHWPIDVDRLRAAEEVFVTSTSQLVMPIVAVDGRTIGSGEGGHFSRDLAARIRARFSLPD